MGKRIKKLLIANRGKIAVRITRTAKKMHLMGNKIEARAWAKKSGVPIIEAMKMENTITANRDAVVKEVNARLNQMVEVQSPLVIFAETSD